MAEAVHKEGLHDTFEVVETPVIQGISLDRVDYTLFFVAKILVDREVVKDRIEQQRPQIFKEEKCAILDLWTQILENYSQFACAPLSILT